MRDFAQYNWSGNIRMWLICTLWARCYFNRHCACFSVMFMSYVAADKPALRGQQEG